MHALKRVLLVVAVCALLGDLTAMFVGPSMLAWYQTPAIGSSLCNCAEASHAAAEGLLHAQLFGMGSGGLVGLGLGIWSLLRQRNKQASSSSSSSTPTSTPPTGTAA